MASQVTATNSQEPLSESPEIKHIKIHHRRHHPGTHERQKEKLARAKHAHHPPGIAHSRKLLAKTVLAQVREGNQEETGNLDTVPNKSPIVPFGPNGTPISYPHTCIGKITVGSGDQVLWTGTGMMCQPR
jgi:hypothetical protein